MGTAATLCDCLRANIMFDRYTATRDSRYRINPSLPFSLPEHVLQLKACVNIACPSRVLFLDILRGVLANAGWAWQILLFA